ncbi:MAG: NAD(P)H-hydrate dehydratase [Cyanobacteria bacterium P01_F01_bin.42]
MKSQISKAQSIVTAAEMQVIESRLFAAGMPVAALMEKVGQRLVQTIEELFPHQAAADISILAGPGHNGGDALVVARELWERGYRVKLHRPLKKAKDLTQSHCNYALYLGIPEISELEEWLRADCIIDGLFGFGLERPIEGSLAATVEQINRSSTPVLSIDIPSGLHTDTGEVLGAAIAADHTLCLGLWKRAFFQEQALSYLGVSNLISFGIPVADQLAVLGNPPPLQTIPKPDFVRLLRRSPAAHKYQIGSALIVCGSSTYPGAAILAAQAARTTGVGMLFVAVPGSIRDLVIGQVPDAVVIACPETPSGAIARLPSDFSLERVTAAAIGPGLTLDAAPVVIESLAWKMPLIVDADALNCLAQIDWRTRLQRQTPTILTPHWGEFKRLLPNVASSSAAQKGDRITMLTQSVLPPETTLVLKGAKTMVRGARLQINRESTSALARGGSGDVLTGIIAGVLAQNPDEPETVAAAAVWWHAQAALLTQRTQTAAGVFPTKLIQNLEPLLHLQHAEKIHEV